MKGWKIMTREMIEESIETLKSNKKDLEERLKFIEKKYRKNQMHCTILINIGSQQLARNFLSVLLIKTNGYIALKRWSRLSVLVC